MAGAINSKLDVDAVSEPTASIELTRDELWLVRCGLWKLLDTSVGLSDDEKSRIEELSYELESLVSGLDKSTYRGVRLQSPYAASKLSPERRKQLDDALAYAIYKNPGWCDE